jgi:hypothetical protein
VDHESAAGRTPIGHPSTLETCRSLSNDTTTGKLSREGRT